MASKVNVRFVVVLSVVLGLVFTVVAATGLYFLLRSGEELVAAGDAELAEARRLASAGDPEAASKANARAVDLYGKAYNHDKSNVDWLTKYRDAIMEWRPTNQKAYEDAYLNKLRGAMSTRAQLLRTDVAAHEQNLRLIHDHYAALPFSQANTEGLIDAVESALANFESDPAAVPGWEVLRRYRGLAVVSLWSSQPDLAQDRASQARADLEAALAARPDDSEVAVGLADWHLLDARRQAADGRGAEAAASQDRAADTLNDFLRVNPASARARVARMELELARAVGAFGGASSAAADVGRVRDAAAAMAGPFGSLADELAAGSPDELATDVLNRLVGLEATITGGPIPRASELVRIAAGRRAQDAEVGLLSGRLLQNEGRAEDAIAEFQRVIDLPIPPVSLEGVFLFERQNQATFRQAEAAMSLRDAAAERLRDADRALAAADESGRAAAEAAVKAATTESDRALDRVRGFREALAKRVSADAPELLLLDAKVELAQNRIGPAQKLLLDYNRITQDRDPDALRLLGQVELRLNNPGVARDRFMRLTQLQPTNGSAWVLLGDAEAMNQNLPGAISAFENATRIAPESEYARTRLAALRQASGDTAAEGGDPVARALIEAVRAAAGTPERPGDTDAGVKRVRDLMASGTVEPRCYLALVEIYDQAGHRSDAVAAIDEGLARFPEDRQLQTVRVMLTAASDTDRQLALIDAAPSLPAVEKLVQKWRVYREARMTAEADAMVTQAAALAPTDPNVIEIRFVDAIDDKRFAEAATIADQAAAADADRVRGLTFRARLQVAESKPRDAIATLQQATQLGTASPEAWRLLGVLQLQNGAPSDAVTSLLTARNMRPTDLPILKTLISALMREQRAADALSYARQAESFAKGDAEFMDMWLRLEESLPGGDRNRALTTREQVRRRTPSNSDNTLALARLYVEAGRSADARPLIDELRAGGATLELIELEASLLARTGDLDGAKKVFDDHIATLSGDAPKSVAAHIAYGQFLRAWRRLDDCLAALEAGRAFQDPKKMEADTALAFTLFDERQNELALAPLRRIVDAGADTADHQALGRLAEALIFLDRPAEAEQVIASVGAAADASLPLTLLRADAARKAGAEDRSRVYLDRAVEGWPSDPLAYVKRAELLRANPDFRQDALQDCATALRLKPDYWHAYQVRALIYNDLGQPDRALDDLRSAVRINPRLDGTRDALLDGLMQTGDVNAAVQVATDAADRASNDSKELMELGDFFARWGQWAHAASFYDLAWKQVKSNDTAVRYALAMIRSPGADLLAIDRVLADPAVKLADSHQLMMTRALLRSRQGRIPEAREDATAAVRIAKATVDIQIFGGVMERLNEVFPDVATRSDFVRTLRLDDLPDLWGQFFKARFSVIDEPLKTEALASLADVAARAQDPDLARVADRLRVTTLLTDRRWEDALAVMTAALAKEPGLTEFNNNVAYVLAAELGRPAEALPYAERARDAEPRNAMVLDTLGHVLHLAGRLDEADRVLGEALAVNAAAEAHVAANIHLGHVKLDKGDRAGAETCIAAASALLEKYPVLGRVYLTKLEALKRAAQ